MFDFELLFRDGAKETHKSVNYEISGGHLILINALNPRTFLVFPLSDLVRFHSILTRYEADKREDQPSH